MRIVFGDPLPVHAPFHADGHRFRVAFGAAGSGKSYAGCDEAIKWALKYPGITGMISRRHITDLRDTTEKVFLNRMPSELLEQCKLSRMGGHYDRCLFPNGSEILFRGLEEWEKKKSINLGFVFLDEMGEQSEDTFHGMRTRLRQRDRTPEAQAMGHTTPLERTGLWGATNPGGKDWVWRLFHPDSPQRMGDAAAFFSTTLDNPYLPRSYVNDMLNMPRHFVLRYVLCQFDDFAGRIYEEFGEPGTIIRHPHFDRGRPGPIVWMGMDPGTRNPTAGVWCWVDLEHNRLVAIAEYKEPGLSVDSHVQRWRNIEMMQRMQVQWRVSDPNSVTQRDRGTQIDLQTQYSRLGYRFALGSPDQDTRIWQLARLIHTRRFVVSEDLPQLQEALREYQWKDLTPAQKARGEDPGAAPLKKNTDLVEASQFVAGRFLPMQAKPWTPTDDGSLSAQVWREVKRAQGRRPTGVRTQNDLGIPI